MATASSYDLHGITDTTGPKISSCAIRMAGVASAKIVGVDASCNLRRIATFRGQPVTPGAGSIEDIQENDGNSPECGVARTLKRLGVSDGDGPAMMTNAATTDRLRQHAAAATTAQKVVIVNGSPEMLDMLDTVLDAAHYDVVFVQSSAHAYSQIKRVQPNVVILCVRIDDADGFQVLSMLKLDEETRGIPVLTYTSEHRGEESDEEDAEPSASELFPVSKAAVWMN